MSKNNADGTPVSTVPRLTQLLCYDNMEGGGEALFLPRHKTGVTDNATSAHQLRIFYSS